MFCDAKFRDELPHRMVFRRIDILPKPRKEKATSRITRDRIKGSLLLSHSPDVASAISGRVR
jgi:hypothetical protein